MLEERRSGPRQRVEYLATLITGKDAPRYCLVTDMSDGGVRVNAVGLKVPDKFGLRLTGHAIPKWYTVIWRVGRNVGAKLIDPTESAEGDRAEIRAE
jgi:hypothetical protein